MSRLCALHCGLVLVAMGCGGGGDDDTAMTVDAAAIAADAGSTDAAALDANAPDAARADAAATLDAAAPDAAAPDAAVPDAVVPDAAVPDAVVPDAAVPDAVVPDAAVPDAVVPDAAPTVCRNFASFVPGGVDNVRECLVAGELCYPDGPASDFGVCGPGDGCDFAAQTGCADAQTCHPAAVFGLDNTDATLCIDAGAGGLYAPCGNSFECAVGFLCIAVSEGATACLPYCDPDAPVCPDGTSCADLSASLIPAVRPSYRVGVCY